MFRRAIVAGWPRDGASMAMRELLKAAILANANALIVVHNHPSGEPEPSSEDIALTRRLDGGRRDHRHQSHRPHPIGDGRYRSLSEEGKM